MEDTALNGLFVTLCLLVPIALLIWISLKFSPDKIGLPYRPNPPWKDVFKNWQKIKEERKRRPFEERKLWEEEQKKTKERR